MKPFFLIGICELQKFARTTSEIFENSDTCLKENKSICRSIGMQYLSTLEDTSFSLTLKTITSERHFNRKQDELK